MPSFDTMKKRTTFIALALFMLTSFAFNAQAQSSNSARIYIYRNFVTGMTFGKYAPPVYEGKSKLAGIDEGRYILLEVPAGSYTFKTDTGKYKPIVIQAEAGKTYFIEMRIRAGMIKTRNQLVMVDQDKARKDFKELRPAKEGDIKDRRVSTTAPTF